jgi:uncharacterized repeat protein (TIGR01451 family)
MRGRAGLAAALALAALAAVPAAQAQVKRGFVNQGFEVPNLQTAGCRVYIAADVTGVTAGQVPAWRTTHPPAVTENVGACVVPPGFAQTAPILEVWRTPRNNNSGGAVVAPEGFQIAELNATVAAQIFQNVCMINGETVRWRFAHRGRASDTLYDVMDLKYGRLGDIRDLTRVGTTNTGLRLAPVDASGNVSNTPVALGGGWVRYTGAFTFQQSTGGSNIGFEAVSTGNGVITGGNLIDDIQISLAPFVEFTQASSSTPESASSNLPTLRVNGTVTAPFAITVNVTGGTAVLGTDFTTPGNSPVLTINVPVGEYDGTALTGSLFPLPVIVVGNAISDGSRNVVFTVAPSTAPVRTYFLFSSASCGAPAQATWDYTITDDDQGIALAKSAAAATPVAGQPGQFDVRYTVTVTNPSAVAVTYGLVDTPGFDPDTTINSASYTRNGGASSALSGSGPWVLQAPGAALAPGVTDVYVLNVRFTVNRVGPNQTANDACPAVPVAGAGLYNSVNVVLNGIPGNTFTSAGCTPTPTPVWVQLGKLLVRRILPSDQAEVRVIEGGTTVATAITTGSANPSTASTGLRVSTPGDVFQFNEVIRANGAGADLSAAAYRPSIACTNAGTVFAGLPSGPATASGVNSLWPAFTPPPGADINCTITNSPPVSDLRITKTNAQAQVVAGQTTTYTVVVSNVGPDPAANAVVRDPVTPGLNCTSASCIAGGGASCPAQSGAALASALQAPGGAIVPVLPSGGIATFALTCTVTASGL